MRAYLTYFKLHPYFALNFLCTLSVAIFLRSYQLDRTPGLNGDEAYTTVQMHELSHSNGVDLSLPTHRTLSPIYGTYVRGLANLLPGFTFWNVRLPALIAGISLIGFSLLFLYWALGLPRALVASLLILSHPMNIAYSRSAVEQSLMGLAALFPIYFALEGSWISAVLALGLGVVIHPLNIFLSPIVLLTLWANVKYRKLKPTTLFALGLLIALSLFLLLKQVLPDNEGFANVFSALHYLWTEPQFFFTAFLRYCLYFIRILTGFSAYEYFAGAPSKGLRTFWDLSFITAGTALVYLGLRGCLREKRKRESYYLAGLVLSVLALFIVGGPKSLSVGLSRYGVFLIVPMAIAVAILLDAGGALKKRKPLWGISVLAWLFLGHFWQCYFVSIYRTGGGVTHRTYATGPTEPKSAVFDWIISERRKEGNKLPIRILTEDWWIYWPMRYLALPHQATIEIIELNSQMHAADFDRLFGPGTFAVGFPGGPVWNHLHQRFGKDLGGGPLLQYQPPSYSKDKVLTAWRYQPLERSP